MSKWKVTYILDTDEEDTEVTADDERGARYEAQRQFGSPIEITKVDELHGSTKTNDGSLPITAEQVVIGDTIITTQHNFPFTVEEREVRQGYVWVRGEYVGRNESTGWHRMSPSDNNVRRYPANDSAQRGICKHCGLLIEEYKGQWWTGNDFQCPDGEENHAPEDEDEPEDLNNPPLGAPDEILIVGADDVNGVQQFWNTDIGWTVYANGTRFTAEQQQETELPAGGRWAEMYN